MNPPEPQFLVIPTGTEAPKAYAKEVQDSLLKVLCWMFTHREMDLDDDDVYSVFICLKHIKALSGD